MSCLEDESFWSTKVKAYNMALTEVEATCICFFTFPLLFHLAAIKKLHSDNTKIVIVECSFLPPSLNNFDSELRVSSVDDK